MKRFPAVIEQDSATGLYVGFVPGFPGAHSQGGTLDELQHNLQEVITMLMERYQCYRYGYCEQEVLGFQHD